MDVGPEEIAVYEALFSYGIRGIVPSLVAERASAPDPFELFLAASGKLAKMGGFAPASESQVKVIEIPRAKVASGKRKAERSPCDVLLSQRGGQACRDRGGIF
ncbi:unnamed protein product [Cochlearia groenlandica]